MGVQGILSYILQTPGSRTRLDLKWTAEQIHKETTKQAEILCDFYPVLKWLLASFEGTQIQMGKLSPYSIMYGGVLPEASQRVLQFVGALQSINVTPIFFIAGPPGSDGQRFDSVLPELCQRYQQRIGQCSTIHQVCAKTENLTQLEWTLREDVALQVEFSLKSCDIRLVHCAGEVVDSILQYVRTHVEVCGVLSDDTVYAVAAQSKLFLPGLFDVDSLLGIHGEEINSPLAGLMCEAVTPASLATSLGLKQQQLADFAVLCGNEFSREHNRGCLPCEKLGMDGCGVSSIAKWLQRRENSSPLLANPAVQEFLLLHPAYTQAISNTHLLYNGCDESESIFLNSNSNNDVRTPIEESGDVKSYLGAPIHGIIPDSMMAQKLTSIANGIYWRFLLPEATKLNQPSFNDVTLPLRRKIYLLLGLKRVTEFGRTTSKSFEEVCLSLPENGINPSILAVLNSLGVDEKLSVLFSLVACPEEEILSAAGGLDRLVNYSSSLGSNVKSGVSSKAVLICACFVFLYMSDHKHRPSPGIRICEFDALLVTCLTCAAGLPPCHVASLPPARAITVGMLFTHILQQVYLLASLLGLSSELPAPSEVFYPLPYIAYHMASYISDCERDAQLQGSSQLSEAYGIFNTVLEFNSVLPLRAELFNHWRSPDVVHLLSLFNSALKSFQLFRGLLNVQRNLPKVMTRDLDVITEMDTRGGAGLSGTDASCGSQGEESEKEGWSGEDDHPIRSDNSDIALHCCSELPASEEYLVSEENLYLSVQSQPHDGSPPPDYVTDVIVHAVTDATVSSAIDLERRRLRNDDVREEALNEMVNCHDAPPERLLADRKPEAHTSHALPILEHRAQILELINSHQVVCIEGETGCGKSTKVPQFILDEALRSSSSSSVTCRMLVTQPRRVAAVRLAERVARERRERLGKTVGYCIGGHHRITSHTALTYCTMGYMLQVSEGYWGPVGVQGMCETDQSPWLCQ